MAERKNGTYKGNTNGIIRQLPNGYQDLTQGDKIKLGLQSAKEHGVKLGRPEYWTEDKALEFADALEKWLLDDDNNVFYIRFTAEYGVYNEILFDLSNKFESFSKRLNQIKDIKEEKIASLSFDNKKNPIFGMFTLKSLYKWNDRAGQMNTDGSTPIQINFSFTQPVNPSQIPPSNNTQPIIDITPDPNKIDNTDNVDNV